MNLLKECCLMWGVLLVMISSSIRLVAIEEEFTVLENCKLDHDDGNDGDSFRVKLESGEVKVFRLYGVDCLETNDREDYMKQRLDTQAYYFGIFNKFDPNRRHQSLIQMGDAATKEMKRLIGKGQKFNVVTRYRDARGGQPRFYAYIFIDDKDLGKELVKVGLARVYGFVDDLPDVDEGSYWRELDDSQMIALGNKQGIWSRTDWREFSKERAMYRKLTGKININNIKNNPETIKLIAERSSVSEKLVKALLDGIAEGPYLKQKDFERVNKIGVETAKDLGKVLKFK